MQEPRCQKQEVNESQGVAHTPGNIKQDTRSVNCVSR